MASVAAARSVTPRSTALALKASSTATGRYNCNCVMPGLVSFAIAWSSSVALLRSIANACQDPPLPTPPSAPTEGSREYVKALQNISRGWSFPIYSPDRYRPHMSLQLHPRLRRSLSLRPSPRCWRALECSGAVSSPPLAEVAIVPSAEPVAASGGLLARQRRYFLFRPGLHSLAISRVVPSGRGLPSGKGGEAAPMSQGGQAAATGQSRGSPDWAEKHLPACLPLTPLIPVPECFRFLRGENKPSGQPSSRMR